MPANVQPEPAAAQREQWLALLHELTDQVAAWAEAQRWSIDRGTKEIDETTLGIYTAPTLRIRAQVVNCTWIPSPWQCAGPRAVSILRRGPRSTASG